MSETMRPLRPEFLHRTEFTVRWDELDANGHVNNKVYQSYLDEARVQAMTALGIDFRKLRAKNTGPVITRFEIDYRNELNHPDAVIIESVPFQDGKFRAQFRQKLIRKSDGKTVAEAVTHWVFMNFQKRRPVLFSDLGL